MTMKLNVQDTCPVWRQAAVEPAIVWCVIIVLVCCAIAGAMGAAGL